jgi:hypothetical protein
MSGLHHIWKCNKCGAITYTVDCPADVILEGGTGLRGSGLRGDLCFCASKEDREYRVEGGILVVMDEVEV